MQCKSVYLNDLPIGEASTWAEVDALLKVMGLGFVATPGAAEGPTGFFLYGTRAQRHVHPRPKTVGGAGEGRNV